MGIISMFLDIVTLIIFVALILATQIYGKTSKVIVSSGHSCAFYAVFVLLEYVPTIPPPSTYVTVSCSVLFKS